MPDFDQRVILGLLLEHEPAHLATDELARELGGDQARVRAADALAALERAGLAHRDGGFAWPTTAARRALELRV